MAPTLAPPTLTAHKPTLDPRSPRTAGIPNPPAATVVLVFLALAGCARTRSSPSPDFAPSDTAHPTASSTAAPHPTLVPTGTPSPSTTAPLLRLLTTPFDWAETTVTPIPTPPLPADSFKLRSWTEQDAITALQTIDQYIRDSNVVYVCESRGDFQAGQRAARILASEAILRFPDSPRITDFRWRLAFADAVTDRASSDEWILTQLTADLAQQEFTTDTLGRLLAPRGFIVFTSLPALNLFGDSSPARIYGIRTYEAALDGLLFAVRTSPSGGESVIPISSLWGFTYIDVGDIAIADHTRDGIPEVLVPQEYCNCGCYPDGGEILQWEDNQFVDLAPRELRGYWLFEELDDNGFEVIHDYDRDDFDNTFSATYRWQGSSYQLASSEPGYLESVIPTWTPDPEERLAIAASSAADSLLSGLPPLDIIPTIRRYLETLPAADDSLMQYEAEEAARTRYILALAYELAPDAPAAAVQYWTIWSLYPNTPYAIISAMKLEASQ